MHGYGRRKPIFACVQIDTIHIRGWKKFLTTESYHLLKEAMTVLRGKRKKQVVLKQE
jgi:hypothetical protein